MHDDDESEMVGEAGKSPELFLSAERTLLSWSRTTLQMIGIGFVVARFGFVLKVEGQSQDGHVVPAIIGASIVLLGSLALAYATWQHRQFCCAIDEQQAIPPGYLAGPTLIFSLLLTLLGLALAVFLLMGIRL
jgi:putative membrane protein